MPASMTPATDLYDDAFGNIGAEQVAAGGTAQVMENPAWNTGGLRRPCSGILEIPHGHAIRAAKALA